MCEDIEFKYKWTELKVNSKKESPRISKKKLTKSSISSILNNHRKQLKCKGKRTFKLHQVQTNVNEKKTVLGNFLF